MFHLLTIASGLLEVDQCLQRRIRRHKRCVWALKCDYCKVEREKEMKKEFGFARVQYSREKSMHLLRFVARAIRKRRRC